MVKRWGKGLEVLSFPGKNSEMENIWKIYGKYMENSWDFRMASDLSDLSYTIDVLRGW